MPWLSLKAGCGAGRRRWGSRVARFRFRRVFAAVVWRKKDRLSVFPQKKQKKINFALKKIDFFFGIYYTLKRTAKIAAKFVADMAQVVERVLGKDEVPGSSPGISSSKKRICNLQVRFFCVKKAGGSSGGLEMGYANGSWKENFFCLNFAGCFVSNFGSEAMIRILLRCNE